MKIIKIQPEELAAPRNCSVLYLNLDHVISVAEHTMSDTEDSFWVVELSNGKPIHVTKPLFDRILFAMGGHGGLSKH